jgi:hypothetical protein
MSLLDDGTYDVVVIDAREGHEEILHLELAVTSGEHRGEVVTVAARGLRRRALDLLGTPATLVVTDGEPHITFS